MERQRKKEKEKRKKKKKKGQVLNGKRDACPIKVRSAAIA
jgi:hypothetical protein